jgi:hypothetical protein
MSNQVNPHAKVQFAQIGVDKSPVVIVDDFLVSTEAAISEARSLNFNQLGDDRNRYYPGVRSSIGGDYGMTVLRAISGFLYQQCNVPSSLTLYPIDGVYSLVSTPVEHLDLLQCIPHYDNNEAHSFAALHYLNEGDFGGTGFFRHIPTGYEQITQERVADYLRVGQEHFDIDGPPKQQYFTKSEGQFELFEQVAYRPNRLVLYPSTLLHSGLIRPEDINGDPLTGRLTANFFIGFD